MVISRRFLRLRRFAQWSCLTALALGLTVLLAAGPEEVVAPPLPRFLSRIWLAEERPPNPCDSRVRSEPIQVIAEGRVVAYPGAEVVVGSELSGRIVALAVDEKSPVRVGDLIAQLDTSELQAGLAEAEARIREAEADERFAASELRREEGLIARKAGTLQRRDELRHHLDTARARRAAACAVRDRYLAWIAKSRITAPIDGVVTARFVHPGETLEAGARVVTIVDLDRLRIEAEVDEYDTAQVTLGATATISAEGYSVTWTGVVEEIPDTVGGRKLRPEDPGRPIDARVLAVKIAIPRPFPLKLGQRVEVAISGLGGEPAIRPAFSSPSDHEQAFRRDGAAGSSPATTPSPRVVNPVGFSDRASMEARNRAG